MKSLRFLLPALAAIVLASVSCQKPLGDITINVSSTQYEMEAGETLTIPFTLGELTKDGISASLECADENFDVKLNMSSTDPSTGEIVINAPEYIYNSCTFSIVLSVSDKVNSRLSFISFEVSADANVEVLVQGANTFIVEPGTICSFNAAKGSTASGVDFDSVELLWQDKIGLVKKVFEHDGKIIAHLGEGEGNAVVVAKKEGKVAWSWTLWITDEEPKDVTVGAYTFMDRNIGALNTTAGSEFSCGNMYQWGRKDAFAGADADNGLKKMYDIEGNEVTRTEGLVEVSYNIDNARENPLVHYHQNYPSSKGNYSWITLDISTVDMNKVAELWGNGGEKTEADPCPTGYRVASPEAWAAVAELAAEPIFDDSYTPSAEVQAKWMEKYKAQYIKQSQFRGAKFGELTLLGSGEMAHNMSFGQGFGGSSNNVVATVWSNAVDPDMIAKNSSSYFRGLSVKMSYSYSADKVTLNAKNKICFAYEQPVRCIKDTK